MKTFSSFILTLLLSLNAMAQVNGNGNDPENFPELSEADRRLLLEQHIDIEGMMLMRHRGGNGGDSIAAEFTTIAQNASIILDDICLTSTNDLCYYRDDFKDMLNKDSDGFVKVLSAPSVLAYDDKPRDAVNFVDSNGRKNIIVGADRWEEINRDYYGKTERKFILVIHEYFSLLGLESSDYYPKSSELFSMIQRNGFEMNRIASNKLVPESCSINILKNDSLEDNLYRDIESFMIDKNFSLKDSDTNARYVMKTTVSCEGGGLFSSDSCSVYTEIIDTLKFREVVYDQLASHKGWMRMNKVRDIAFNKALEDIKACE